MGKKVSYSQSKRDKLDYRKEYFKHNPGIRGCIWECGYCHKYIIGKENVHVDHIMPLNNVMGQNKRYNLIAACSKCNLRKSDKVDGRVLVGYTSKIIEEVKLFAQKAIVLAFVAIRQTGWMIIRGAFTIVWSLLSAPYRGNSMFAKILATLFYGVIVYSIFNS